MHFKWLLLFTLHSTGADSLAGLTCKWDRKRLLAKVGCTQTFRRPTQAHLFGQCPISVMDYASWPGTGWRKKSRRRGRFLVQYLATAFVIHYSDSLLMGWTNALVYLLFQRKTDDRTRLNALPRASPSPSPRPPPPPSSTKCHVSFRSAAPLFRFHVLADERG